MRRIEYAVILACATAILAFLSEPAKARPFTDEAEIKVRNAATSDGTITFIFAPKGAPREEIDVAIEDGWDERRIAREIEAVFNNHIGANYNVTWNNKRQVRVEKRNKKKRFYLGKSSQTAHGVTIAIDYD